MRRLATATVLALVAALAPSVPASATDFELVYYSAPDGWASISGPCTGSGDPHAFAGPHYGPGQPPGGTGSLEIYSPLGQLGGTGTTYSNFGNLDAIAASVWETAGSSFEFRIDVVTDSGYRTLVWAPNPANGQWVEVQPNFASTVWTIYETGTTTSLGTTTLDAYQALWPTKNWSPQFVSAGCSAESTVYLNAIMIQATDIVDKVWDFEAQPTSVTMAATAGTLTFGQKVTLSTLAKQLGQPLPEGVGVQLWAKPSGKSWSKVATVLTNSEGRASKTLMPRVTTRYQWRYPSYGSNQPSQSPEKQVGVRAKVTIELLDDRVGKGDRIAAVGKVTPDKAGVTATLWRDSATGRIKLGTTTVKADGTYKVLSSVITAAGSATWKVYVTVPAEGGNLAGKSPVVAARIN